MVELGKSNVIEAGRLRWQATGAGQGFLVKSPEGSNFFVDTDEEVLALIQKQEKKREGRNGATVIELEWRRTDEIIVR